jgi:hypothetical protein
MFMVDWSSNPDHLYSIIRSGLTPFRSDLRPPIQGPPFKSLKTTQSDSLTTQIRSITAVRETPDHQFLAYGVASKPRQLG